MKIIRKMVLEMTKTPNWRERPTCAQLLSDKWKWSLNISQLNEWKDFDSMVKELNENENKFFEIYFEQKFKYLKPIDNANKGGKCSIL